MLLEDRHLLVIDPPIFAETPATRIPAACLHARCELRKSLAKLRRGQCAGKEAVQWRII